MPVSVRLEPEEEQALRRIAKRRRTTVSEVIRDALSDLVEEAKKGPHRPYDRMAHLIGAVKGLPSDLSQRTGERFSEILREKARRRR